MTFLNSCRALRESEHTRYFSSIELHLISRAACRKAITSAVKTVDTRGNDTFSLLTPITAADPTPASLFEPSVKTSLCPSYLSPIKLANIAHNTMRCVYVYYVYPPSVGAVQYCRHSVLTAQWERTCAKVFLARLTPDVSALLSAAIQVYDSKIPSKEDGNSQGLL